MQEHCWRIISDTVSSDLSLLWKCSEDMHVFNSSLHQAVARGVVEEIEEEIKELELLPLPLQKLRPLDGWISLFGSPELETGAGMVREKNMVGLAAERSDWRVRIVFSWERTIKGLACSRSAFASVLKPEKGHSCVQLVMGTWLAVVLQAARLVTPVNVGWLPSARQMWMNFAGLSLLALHAYSIAQQKHLNWKTVHSNFF